MSARMLCLITVFGVLFGACGMAAAEGEEAKEVIRAKEVTGEISAVSRGFVSIVYERDEKNGTEYEMMFPINEDIKFTRKRLDELAAGDKVRVKCDDYFINDAQGKEICARRVAREIQFLSPPVKKLAGEER